MISGSLYPIANHLWQSTLFAAAAGLLALASRKNPARVRHWIWVAASLKFLVPFSLLVLVGSFVYWHTDSVTTHAGLSVALDRATQPFANPVDSILPRTAAPANASALPEILWAVWAGGFAGIVCSWWIRWRRIKAAVRAGSRVQLDLPIAAVCSRSFLEPGVFGVVRPVLLLPEGIFENLTPEQWKSIIAHELCHVRHRDNLIGLIQMFVEAAFWFYPPVWWIGTRIIRERERACDEEVLRLGSEPRTYAQGILKICELYLESPVACVAGVSGSNLTDRIEAIMLRRVVHNLGPWSKILLAAAGGVVFGLPITLGHLKAQPVAFEVASIKPSPPGLVRDTGGVQIQFPPGGGFAAANVTLKDLVMTAYSIEPWQVSGGPEWTHPSGMSTDDRFVVNAKAASAVGRTETRRMLQALLADRFRLRIHRISKTQTVYDLVVAKNGLKIREIAAADYASNLVTRCCRGGMYVERTTMPDFAASFTMLGVHTTVHDKTGLKGVYKFELHWTPEVFRSGDQQDSGAGGEPAFDWDGPSLFTALRDQLGLTLEARKGSVEVLVIDRADRPSEN
jgi:uncharacterized protein (TIGR03435 family)